MEKCNHNNVDFTGDHYDIVESKPFVALMRHAVSSLKHVHQCEDLRHIGVVCVEMHVPSQGTVGIYEGIGRKTEHRTHG